jgi:hypothetical protein
MMLTMGMSISGKMSVGVFRIEAMPKIPINTATMTKV